MKILQIALLAAASAIPSAAAAVEGEGPLTVSAPAEAAPALVLPANTEVNLRLNDTITTKGSALNEGDTFALTVTDDVMMEGYVVIPRGARATGRVAWMTSKGAFGKSGKMDIAIDYVSVNGRRIPLEGKYRQEGEGNTVATIGGVIAVGVLAGFVTGKSATIPQGRELMARTKEDVALRIRPRVETYASRYAPHAEGPVRTAFEPSPALPQRRARGNWGLVEVRAP